MNNTYEVGHITAKLTDGTYTERDGADSQNTTSIRIISLPVRGSINGDKYDDAAIVLESQMSGQVPSYYVGASLGARNGASPTNTIYMGDGIEILGIEVEDDIIWVFTLERRENESMDNAPTIERVRQYIMRDGALHEIA